MASGTSIIRRFPPAILLAGAFILIFLLVQLLFLFKLVGQEGTENCLVRGTINRKPEVPEGKRIFLWWEQQDMSKSLLNKWESDWWEQECRIPCYLTWNTTYMDSCDVIIFDVAHGTKLPLPTDPDYPFKNRKSDQLYIFYGAAKIPPSEYKIKFQAPPFFFNQTVTYRRDSSVEIAGLETYNADEPGRRRHSKHPQILELSKKTRIAAYVNNQCETGPSESGRELLVDKLKGYISVDEYGTCYSSQEQFHEGEESDGDSFRRIGRTHKFLLAFERALCQDFHTEMIYHALDSGMVPVVYGDAAYAHILPKDSYINVANFPTVQELAKHLLHLDQNDDIYLRHFEWKKTTVVQNGPALGNYCRLCELLHMSYRDANDDEWTHESLEDAERWWVMAEDGFNPACRAPPEFV